MILTRRIRRKTKRQIKIKRRPIKKRRSTSSVSAGMSDRGREGLFPGDTQGIDRNEKIDCGANESSVFGAIMPAN
jgi:hypothetical protein